MKKSSEQLIKVLKSKIENEQNPEIKASLENKLKVFEGNKTVLK